MYLADTSYAMLGKFSLHCLYDKIEEIPKQNSLHIGTMQHVMAMSSSELENICGLSAFQRPSLGWALHRDGENQHYKNNQILKLNSYLLLKNY